MVPTIRLRSPSNFICRTPLKAFKLITGLLKFFYTLYFKMLIKPISDVHLEFADLYLPKTEQDKDTILVLAGDTGLVHKPEQFHERFLPFISRCAYHFKHVVMIFGNHEHYHGSFLLTEEKFWNGFCHFNIHNVSILEKKSVIIDDVAFIGATLWTDCDKDSGYSEIIWQRGMADSQHIRTGDYKDFAYDRKLTALDTIRDHVKAKQFVWSEVDKYKAEGKKTVVVVHHGVSGQSIHPMYAGSQFNMFFSSELTPEIQEHKPDIIIHGHTHMAFDYMIDDTRVIVNPRGYEGYETDPVLRGFDIDKIIEI